MSGSAPSHSRRALLLAAAGTTAAAALHAQGRGRDEPTLERIDDLRPLLAEVQRERRPLLLFFSTPGCPYCLEVRRNYLAPRVKEGATKTGILIREVLIVGDRSFIGVDGKPLREADFARRFNVRAVPVVVLVDAELKLLGEPLVGIDASGFYEAYLQRAIDEARSQLR